MLVIHYFMMPPLLTENIQRGHLPSDPILCHFFGIYKTEYVIRISFLKLLQKELPMLWSAFLLIMILSLTRGMVPSSFKAALIQLLLK